MRTTFAPASASRDDTAGPAKPGEDRHLDRPDVRARMRCDRSLGRHRQERPDRRRPRRRRARASASASRRTSCESSAHVSERRSPSSGTHTAASRSGVSRAQRWTHAFGDVEPRAHEPRRPLDPARVVEHGVPVVCERDPEVVDDGTPEAIGLFDRDPMKLVVPEQPSERASRATFAAPTAPRSASR